MELYDYDSTMSSTQHFYRCANRRSSLLAGLLAIALARTVLAGDFAGNTYTNNGIVTYPGTESHPPAIDATNFINNNTFIINFTTLSITQPFYETSDTINYTNNGLMMANTGFRLDTQSSGSGSRTMAGVFNNPGTVSCGSTNNTTAPILFGSAYEQCLVNATNILNSGTIDVGMDGMIQLTGQNVNLTRGSFVIEGEGLSGANIGGTGYYDLNTNFWDPNFELGPTSAISAPFPVAPLQLALTNSTAYFHFTSVDANNNTIQGVFVEDTSGPNVTQNVYFGIPSDPTLGFGGVTIEWAGSYVDAASGILSSNYLYLNNDYLQGVATNDGILGSVPNNFTFTQSSTNRILQTPDIAGFVPIFPPGSITNRYAFANVQLISTTTGTNNIANLAITNLPGRVQINAGKDLDLSLVRITGPNYLSIQSPIQFEGSAGARIVSPYSDFNVGVTNGFLTVSNLLQPTIPNWSGTVQAWSTRWVTVDSTGVTNDFRVLIVGSQLNPTTLGQVQDLILHGTNSIVISDTFNVMRTFKADAQNLTLTTNAVGAGATSLDGELNVGSANIFWADSLPNLRNLTNCGAIRLQNLAHFIGSSNNIVITPPVAAAATLSEVVGRTNVLSGNKLVIGTNQYVFVGRLTNTMANQIKIAAQFDGTMNNLIAAIAGAAGAGTNYSTNTTANAQVTVGPLTNHAFAVTARATGLVGNTIPVILSTPTTNLTWSGSTLSGGAESITNGSSASIPYFNFVNHGLVSDQGSIVWANNFENSGVISNGAGAFQLGASTVTLTNGAIIASNNNVSITATTLLVSNVVIQAGGALTLTANLLTDTGATNGNIWSLGGAAAGSFPGIYLANGFNLPIKPDTGDLLGTTVTNIAPDGKLINNLWAGEDRGVSVDGYVNNEAIGQLILDARGQGPGTQFYFSGTGANNAIYVDRLVLENYASYTNHTGSSNLVFNFNTNLVIYFADAVDSSLGEISPKLDGFNGNHFRWIPTYTGYFTSTNIVYPDGTTNTFNAGLAGSQFDSDADGILNASDPSPFFVPSMINPQVYPTNNPAGTMVISWNTIPFATNSVAYSTNLMTWQLLTNFISPQTSAGPATNVLIFDPIVSPGRYYQVTVSPWLTFP